MVINLKHILFSILVLGVNVCIAQQVQPKSDRFIKYASTLSIDEVKAKEIASILNYYDLKMLEIFKDKKNGPKSIHSLAVNLVSEKELKIRALLTDEQFNLLKQMFKGQMDRAKEYLDLHVQKNNQQLGKPMKGGELKKVESIKN